MQIIETKNAPVPGGHYSQAVIANGMIFVAGLLPLVPNTNGEMPNGIAAQTKQVFKNLEAILDAADSALSHLINVQIFIPDMESWGVIDEIYKSILNAHKPARTIIPCGHLRNGALIEANAVASVIPQLIHSRGFLAPKPT